MRVAILSDLHAVNDLAGHATTSQVRMSQSGDPLNNPLDGLKALIQEDGLRADILLCPGDLTDRADPKALTYAWEEIHAISTLLGATVVATTGNHDVDSRFAHDSHDTYGSLQELTPDFPCGDYDLANEFFARQVTCWESDTARVFVLDSCHFHRDHARHPPAAALGGHDERARGRVSRRALRLVQDRLSVAPPIARTSIVLCHHHPTRWTEPVSEHDEMEGGEELVRMLEQDTDTGWILVHGHRHTPSIDYLGRTSGGPVRFSAGSVGGALPQAASGMLRNQFYLLDIVAPSSHLRPAASFQAWDWVDGWRPATKHSRIPGRGGFGFRASGRDLAHWVENLGPTHFSYEDLISTDPRLRFLAPVDWKVLMQSLDMRGHGVTADAHGRIAEIALL